VVHIGIPGDKDKIKFVPTALGQVFG